MTAKGYVGYGRSYSNTNCAEYGESGACVSSGDGWLLSVASRAIAFPLGR